MNASTRLRLAVALLGCLHWLAFAAAEETSPNTLTDKEKSGGWKLLFDGQTTNGWRSYRQKELNKGWKVVDGALCRAEKGAGDIVTADEYDRFELSLEYKISQAGNSGLMYHVTEDQLFPWMTGPEVQIQDNKDGHDPQKAGWVYQLYPAETDATKPAGEWNQIRILVTPEKCQTFMNGVKYAEYVKGSKDWDERVANSKFAVMPRFGKPAKGYICLQDHGDVVCFRSVKIREIPPEQVEAAETDAVPQGEVAKYSFENSKIFPGTVRDYWVYVPKQYDPARPACVHVNQDNVQFEAPKVFDRLIHAKEMPVVIGVFVTPGRLKAPSDAALDRFNRSFEYDGLGDDYVRFLLEELLPDVEKRTASNGRAIRLSRDGNDRAIGGSSSGAICAFTAAWERPDAFRRVFSAIGTYVGLRGGNVYPTIVRKFEPKPLRVFLQDGSGDLNIYGGDWWMANQEMERALTFAGYEVNHSWGDGGHNGKHATEIFADATRWLWKDWPSPIKTGAGSPQLQEILIPGEDWKLVAEGYRFTEGPAVNEKGEVFYNDVPSSKTYKVGLDGQVSVFLNETRKGDGQRFGPDGRLYSVAGGADQIVAYDTSGKATVVADGFRGNDLVVRHDGSIYATNPGWNGTDPSKVWLIKPSGEKQVVDTGLKFSNGLTLSPDQSLLYVADSRTHWVYSYQVQPDGGLGYKQRYYHLHVPDTADDSGADGMRVDRDGRLYVATRMGIQVCDQAGRVNAIIPTPNGKVSNLCFGGPEFDILFATCGDRVYQRKVKTRGANSFQPPIKPAAPRL